MPWLVSWIRLIFRHQLTVLLGSTTLRPTAPCVITASRDLQQLAHHANRIAGSATFNALVLHFGCLAKYVAASFKKITFLLHLRELTLEIRNLLVSRPALARKRIFPPAAPAHRASVETAAC